MIIFHCIETCPAYVNRPATHPGHIVFHGETALDLLSDLDLHEQRVPHMPTVYILQDSKLPFFVFNYLRSHCE